MNDFTLIWDQYLYSNNNNKENNFRQTRKRLILAVKTAYTEWKQKNETREDT